MADLVIRVAGAVVGGFIGGPFGAQVGWAVGGLAASALADPKHLEGARLADLKVTGVEYGQPITRALGHPRLPGQIAWASEKRPVAHTTSSGGKGEPETTSTTYTNDVDIFYLLTDNVGKAVTRAWLNGKLIYNVFNTAPAATIAASLNSDKWTAIRFYLGDSDDMPDTVYEAVVGVGNAQAYRGRFGVFIEGLHLDSSGQIPQLTFEI